MTFNQYSSRMFGTNPGGGDDFAQFFSDIFGTPFRESTVKTTVTNTGNVKHTATVPGFGAEDLQVNVEDARLLTVSTKPTKDEKGKLLARVTLVEGADYTNAKATVKNGLLTVTVPYSAVPVETFSLDVTDE